MVDCKSKSKSLDWTAQLVMLRDMTRHFGTIHEAQVLQLRGWPFTVDPSLEKSEARVDIEGKKVEFVWTGSTMKIDKKYQFRLKTLGSNVKFLLGDDWEITVNSNGVTIFNSNDKRTPGARSKRRDKRSRRKISNRRREK
jgi:hypothetical protein